jgi:diguanylate cyclase
MNLRHKTLLFVMPLIIIPILMIGSVAFYKLKEANEDRLNTQIDTLLDQISQYVISTASVAEANLLLLADHQLVTQYALTTNETVKYELLLPNILGIFKNIQKSIPDYYEIRFILPDGFEDAYWASDDINNLDTNIRNDSYFPDFESSNDRVFKRIIFDENTREYSLLLIHKLLLNDPAVDTYGSPPTLRGFIAITVSLDHLRDDLNKNIIGESGFLMVIDNNGEVIISPDKRASALSESFSGHLINRDLINYLNLHKQKTVEIDDTHISIHLKSLFANLSLLGVVPESEILDNSRELGKLILIITLLSILTAILLVFIALRQLILQPLSDLDEAAQSIGNGNLDLNISINSNDEISSLARTFMEMSKSLKRTHDEVSYTANHDGLTGLPNRSMFQEYLSKILLFAKQNEQKVALLFLDLDDFKHINDSQGHPAGDILLREVATRLSTTLRKKDNPKTKKYNKASDLVARLGGDEFIILLNEIDGPFDATAVADRLLKNLHEPVNVYDNHIYVNCSIGITLFPDDGSDANELIKNADIAMYHAKEQGKNHYQFYSKKLNTDMQNRLQMNAKLRIALEKNLFFLHYQPKVDNKSGNIIGLEALLRWHDPDLGMVSPALFIAVAEESGLITPITEWVFNEVCRQCMEWKKSGVDIVPVAVNVSSIQFKRRDLVTMIKNSLDISGLSPNYIEVELTETSLLTDTAIAVEVLNGLNALGIKVALDDFGTGYSSLSYLNKLPIHTLKIDRSFVNTIIEPNRDYAIVDAIIALGHALDLHIVAEGVETTTQLEYLTTHHCDSTQGYLFCKPLPKQDIPQILTRNFHKQTLS